MKIKSPAKINLVLHVLGKSGKYHRIVTVLQKIGLHDLLTFEKTAAKKIIIKCADPAVPAGSKNTVFKAAALLKTAAKKSLQKNITGVKITIRKNIPVAAGLGGGSSNAAAALIALNKLWGLDFTKDALSRIGVKIGMDVPFFIQTPAHKSALGTHYGEKITLFRAFSLPPFLIACNAKKTGTKSVYKKLDLLEGGFPEKPPACLKKPLSRLSPGGLCLHNDFDLLLNDKHDDNMRKTKALMDLLLHYGATGVHICGSGPSVYAFFKNRGRMHVAFNKIKDKIPFAWKSQ